jgi:hypothetical protein
MTLLLPLLLCMSLPEIALHPECALVNITLLPEKKYRGVFVGYQWFRRKKYHRNITFLSQSEP